MTTKASAPVPAAVLSLPNELARARLELRNLVAAVAGDAEANLAEQALLLASRINAIEERIAALESKRAPSFVFSVIRDENGLLRQIVAQPAN